MEKHFIIISEYIAKLNLLATKNSSLSTLFKKDTKVLKVWHKLDKSILRQIKRSNLLEKKRIDLLDKVTKYPKYPVVIVNLHQQYGCFGFKANPAIFDPINDCAWDDYEWMLVSNRYKKYSLFRFQPTLIYSFMCINASILGKQGINVANSQIHKIVTDYHKFAQQVKKELVANEIDVKHCFEIVENTTENKRTGIKVGVKDAKKLHPNDIFFDSMLNRVLLNESTFIQQSKQLQLLSVELHLLLDIVFGVEGSKSRDALKSILMEHLQLTSIDVVNCSVELEFLFNLLDYNFMNQVHEYFQANYTFAQNQKDCCHVPYKEGVFYVPVQTLNPRKKFGFLDHSKLVGHLQNVFCCESIQLLKITWDSEKKAVSLR